MRRWHRETELHVMLRRWRLELRQHGYRWGDYVGPYLAGQDICVVSCHCEKGPGHYRKKTPLGHHHSCGMCWWGKGIGMGPDGKFRSTRERNALRAEIAADEPVRYRRKKQILDAKFKHELFMTNWWKGEWALFKDNDGTYRPRKNETYRPPRAFIETIRRDAVQEARRKRKKKAA